MGSLLPPAIVALQTAPNDLLTMRNGALRSASAVSAGIGLARFACHSRLNMTRALRKQYCNAAFCFDNPAPHTWREWMGRVAGSSLFNRLPRTASARYEAAISAAGLSTVGVVASREELNACLLGRFEVKDA
jgi:hypothetical protein